MSTKINIKGENTFKQSPIITGHNNTVMIQEAYHEIDWELWQNELIDVPGKLPESSDEYAASKEALKCSLIRIRKIQEVLLYSGPVACNTIIWASRNKIFERQ